MQGNEDFLDDYLCPDCKENRISFKEYTKRGMCAQCYRRKINSKERGIEYIRVIDLSKEDKDKVLSARKYMRKAFDKKAKESIKVNNKKKRSYNGRTPSVFTDDVVKFIKSLSGMNLTKMEIKQRILDNFPNMKDINANTLSSALDRFKIDYKKSYRGRWNTQKEDVFINEDETPVSDMGVRIDDVNDDLVVQDKVEMPIPVISGEMKLLEDRLYPIKDEVQTILKQKFEQSGCTISNNYSINDYLWFINMIEDLCGNIEKNIASRKTQETIYNEYQSDLLHEMENVLLDSGDTYFQDKMHILREHRRNAKSDMDALEALKPVVNILRNVFGKSTNPNHIAMNVCKKAVEQLVNREDNPIYIPRVDKFMSAKYNWAIDAEPPKKTKTEVTNTKQHQTLYGKTYSTRIGGTIDSTQSQLQKDLAEMQSKIVATRKDGIVASGVSNGLIDRLNIQKVKSDIKLNDSQIKSGVGIYRVSCNISGGGIGRFKTWFRDYSCTDETVALTVANQELAMIRRENSGILITDIMCHKLNVGSE